MTQDALAAKLGTTRQSLHRIVRGEQNWTSSFLVRASEILEIEPGDLLGRDPIEAAEPAATAPRKKG